jgi:hypothetical protein
MKEMQQRSKEGKGMTIRIGSDQDNANISIEPEAPATSAGPTTQPGD